MATSDSSAFESLMARATVPLPPVTWERGGDLARMSVESMTARHGEARELASVGAVRLSGAGVTGHAANLDEVGKIATLWQRCVTAVGAALEGVQSAAGRIPDRVVFQTQLQLVASPGPGSVVLALSPKSDPFGRRADEERPFFLMERPLADRASEELINLLAAASSAGPADDELSNLFRYLGPRVGTSVKALANALDRGHFDFEVSWEEPERPTRRAAVPAGTSGWLRDFVSGRELDSGEDTIEGTIRTVSDFSKWAVDTGAGIRSVDASALPVEVIRAVRVGDNVRIHVRVDVTERPDGATTTRLSGTRIEQLPTAP